MLFERNILVLGVRRYIFGINVSFFLVARSHPPNIICSMPRLLLSLLFLLASSYCPALAQRGPVGVGLEIHGAYASMTDDSFEDLQPRQNIAHGWLNEVSSGIHFEGRFSLRLPWGFRPYVGYHIGRPRESAPNQELWYAIYRNGIPDFKNTFTEESHDVQYRTEGWSAGLIYEPHWLDWAVRPYLFGEARTERFRAETHLTGTVDAENIPELTDSPFTGESLLEAEMVYGYGIGGGLRIPTARLGFSMPFGSLSIVPEVKYVSAPDAQIERREFEWTVLPAAGSATRTTHEGFLTILDGQTIDHRYIAFRLGLRYEPF